MKHYYAEYSPYGIQTVSEGMQLYRFDTRAERDEWVERMNSRDPYRGTWSAATTREVSHRYDLRRFDRDPFGDYRHEHEGPDRTSAGRIPEYVTPRPKYLHFI